MTSANEFRLCFVKEPWAYFTTLPLSEQWGDDWDDAPYEHNAGDPDEDETGKYEIKRLAYHGDFETPCSNVVNSPYSVRDINAGAVAWLTYRGYDKPMVCISAGCSILEFIEKVERGGGAVFAPVSLSDVAARFSAAFATVRDDSP